MIDGDEVDGPNVKSKGLEDDWQMKKILYNTSHRIQIEEDPWVYSWPRNKLTSHDKSDI